MAKSAQVRNISSKQLLSSVGKNVVSSLTLQLIQNGALTLAGKTHAEAQKEAINLIKKIMASGTPLLCQIDHTKDLLSQARSHAKNKEVGLASFYFATYFEHRLNWIIVQTCRQKKLDKKQINLILREANLRAKSTWLLAVLDCRPLSSRAIKTIDSLSTIRNSFVHYKWPSKDLDEEDLQEATFATLARDAEYVVGHMNRFEDRWLYKGQGSFARGIAAGRNKRSG